MEKVGVQMYVNTAPHKNVTSWYERLKKDMIWIERGVTEARSVMPKKMLNT